ncbi:hypothetical protein [Luteimonas sp. 100069]|uniref:hypothetical protein n=1 Tax=Luteimonas sp. 100069 TaxID=2006109 RepID=UPI000F4ECAC7|nr:hypothetical protein [Luteimonas sp. 100069]RPD87648.1 hypothetical protein EGK76_00050 [Luteimonas sp. 100069]
MRQVLMIAALPLSAAGLGLLMWSGMTTALLQLRPPGSAALHQLQLIGMLMGSALLVCGMLVRRFAPAPRLPTAPPGRRTRLLVWTTLGISVFLCALLISGAWMRGGVWLAVLGVVQMLVAFGAVAAMASDHARPPSPPAWQQPLVLPVHLLLAMSTGLALLYLLMDRLLVSGSDGRTMLGTLAGLGICLALFKVVYWRAIDRLATAASRAHTFHAPRVVVLALAAGVPFAAWLLAPSGTVPATALLVMAASGVCAAAVLEHRLFLGEGATPARAAGHVS